MPVSINLHIHVLLFIDTNTFFNFFLNFSLGLMITVNKVTPQREGIVSTKLFIK